MHKKICEKLNKTYSAKQHDYGNSFGDTFDKLGIISAITRISDKYNRLVSLGAKTKEEQRVKDETITDTLLDLANYAIMTVIELHKNDTQPCDSNKSDAQSCNGTQSCDKKPCSGEQCKHDWQYVCYDSLTCQKLYICNKCGQVKTVNGVNGINI